MFVRVTDFSGGDAGAEFQRRLYSLPMTGWDLPFSSSIVAFTSPVAVFSLCPWSLFGFALSACN